MFAGNTYCAYYTPHPTNHESYYPAYHNTHRTYNGTHITHSAAYHYSNPGQQHGTDPTHSADAASTATPAK